MRHLEALAVGPAHPVREADDAAGQQAQPGMLAVLLARVEQQLHPDADAQQRHARAGALDDERVQPTLAECRRTRAERADAGQHEALGLADRARVGRAQQRRARRREGRLERAQVADAVVEENRHGGAGQRRSNGRG